VTWTLVINNPICPLCTRDIAGRITAVRLTNGAHAMSSERRLSFLVHQACGLVVDAAGAKKLDALIESALANRAAEVPARAGTVELEGDVSLFAHTPDSTT
jgi:hypothetical protein